jgi:hypothetical protein
MFFISGEGEGRKVFMGSLLFLRTQEPDRKMYVALASTQSELISQNTRCKTDNLDEIYLIAYFIAISCNLYSLSSRNVNVIML